MDDNEAEAAVIRGRDAARPFVLDHLTAMLPTVQALTMAETAGFWMEYQSRMMAAMVRNVGVDNAVRANANAMGLAILLAARAEAEGPPDGVTH